MKPLCGLLLFLFTFSASGECVSQALYNTTSGYIAGGVIDDGGLYLLLFPAANIQRLDLSTGQTSIVAPAPPGPWDVQHGYLASAGTIGRPADQVKDVKVRDGYVYWVETDGVLRRMIIGGSTIEALAALDVLWPRYAIFEDRVVFINGGHVYWRPLAGGATSVVWSTSNAVEIGTVTRDAILVTSSFPLGNYQARVVLNRISWDGTKSETLYDETVATYHNGLSVTGFGAGATTYIVAYRGGVPHTTITVLRDGVAVNRYEILGPINVLAASEESITFTEWGVGTGMHTVMQLCAVRGRGRAVQK